MGLTKNIKKLVHYGIGAKLIQPEDEIFMINQYLDLFGLDEYDNPDIFGEKMVLADILNELTDIAFERESFRVMILSQEICLIQR